MDDVARMESSHAEMGVSSTQWSFGYRAFPSSRRGGPGMRCPVNKSLIACDPAVMMGKPTVAGTRITVELILEKLASGETIEQLLKAHPRLTPAGVLAALDFANQVLRADVVYPIARQSA